MVDRGENPDDFIVRDEKEIEAMIEKANHLPDSELAHLAEEEKAAIRELE